MKQISSLFILWFSSLFLMGCFGQNSEFDNKSVEIVESQSLPSNTDTNTESTRNTDTNTGSNDNKETSKNNENSEKSENIICNPFAESKKCSPTQSSSQTNGLIGYIYYLKSLHGSYWGLYHSSLDDYFDYGIKVPNLVQMSQINIPARAFLKGFKVADGSIIKDRNGNKLYEWFSLRLSGFIMPNRSSKERSYEFSMLSDDGMRVVIDGQVILEDDGLHEPRWSCTSQSYVFKPLAKKNIEIHYFQGPRTHIAMTLMYRVAGTGQGCPSRDVVEPSHGNWQVVPSDFFYPKKP